MEQQDKTADKSGSVALLTFVIGGDKEGDSKEEIDNKEGKENFYPCLMSFFTHLCTKFWFGSTIMVDE